MIQPAVEVRKIERQADSISAGSFSPRSSARRRIALAKFAPKENSGDTFAASKISDNDDTSPSLRDSPWKLLNSGILSVKHSPTHVETSGSGGDESGLSPLAAGAEGGTRHHADGLCWWDGSQKADTLTTRSIGQMMPDKQQLPCVVDTRFQDAYEPQVSPSILASDYKEPKAVVGACCPTLDASYPAKMNNQDLDKLVCYEKRGQDKPQRVFVMDSMGSNAMKSANPHSGIRETDVAQTLDTTDPSPSKNQGGMAVVDAVAIAENVIGRSDNAGGNGVGAQTGVCYTLDTAGVHGVCYPIDMTNVDGRESNPLGPGFGKENSAAYALTRRRPSGVCTPGVIRRLMPVEEERLMGFPDGWTLIPWRGKPADKCPDGPRYKALGNSMCTNVMAWIGERIDAVEKEKNDG